MTYQDLQRDNAGRWEPAHNVFATIITLILFLAFIASSVALIVLKRDIEPLEAMPAVQTTTTDDGIQECRKVNNNLWDCTDQATLERLPAYVSWAKEAEVVAKVSKTVTAVITRYGRADSCHNPKTVNGKVLCLTAIGRDTKEGVTVACPKSIKLGTKVQILGRTYTCEDRYADWLDTKRGMPTFDIFLEAENTNKLPGRQVATVTIL